MRKLVLAALLALSPLVSADARVLGQWSCTASYQGSPMQGYYQLEFWSRAEIYVHTGRLQARDGTIYDFEVQSASMSGVGGIWQNHMRHREVHMKFQAYRGGFTIQTDRDRVDVRCQM